MFRAQGDPAVVDRELSRLRATPLRRPIRPPRPNVRTVPDGRAGGRAVQAVRAGGGRAGAANLQAPGLAQLTLNNRSEAEIAVSTNGQNIVIAQGFVYSTSTDGGQNWTIDRPILPQPTGGDGSVAFGRSGTFYVATISGSSTAIQATNNTLTLGPPVNAFTCPAATSVNPPPCGFATAPPNSVPIPDQEHIAADRFNAGNAGGDQVYSVWRHGGTGNGIACNNGQAWGGATVFAGDFPRVTVGQDSRVYVVYQNGNGIFLDRFTSCTTGLVSAGDRRAGCDVGSWRMGVGRDSVRSAAMPGLDRCNSGNNLSSFTVAVDDRDATHIFVTYAQFTAANNENIVVQDSVDSGANWLPARMSP